MENNDLYNKYQAGFKPDHRTTYHIFIIKILVNKYIHKLKKPIYTCFVDFAKLLIQFGILVYLRNYLT